MGANQTEDDDKAKRETNDAERTAMGWYWMGAVDDGGGSGADGGVQRGT
jgi:hypothetical protein